MKVVVDRAELVGSQSRNRERSYPKVAAEHAEQVAGRNRGRLATSQTNEEDLQPLKTVMADLEDMLLEAAGRTGTSGRKKQSDLHTKWHREGSSSDGSDSNNEKFSKGNHSGSHVPLKRRFEPSKTNDWTTHWVNKNSDYDDYDKPIGNDSDSALSIGSDLYIDDKDKEELGKMSKLDRMMILAERSTKFDDYRLKKKAQESSFKAEYSTKESPPPLSSRSRLSVRSEKASAKIDALMGYHKFRDLAAAGTGCVDDAEVSSDSDDDRNYYSSKSEVVAVPDKAVDDGANGKRDDRSIVTEANTSVRVRQRESTPDSEGMYASADKRRRRHQDESQKTLVNRLSNSAPQPHWLAYEVPSPATREPMTISKNMENDFNDIPTIEFNTPIGETSVVGNSCPPIVSSASQSGDMLVARGSVQKESCDEPTNVLAFFNASTTAQEPVGENNAIEIEKYTSKLKMLWSKFITMLSCRAKVQVAHDKLLCAYAYELQRCQIHQQALSVAETALTQAVEELQATEAEHQSLTMVMAQLQDLKDRLAEL